MDEHSSFMDWHPATPVPAFDPYRSHYIPGGWPFSPPPPTTGFFSRPKPEGFFLPSAKRICTGIAAGTKVAASVVTVPLHMIVRRIRQQQLRPTRLQRRSTRQISQRPPLSDSPWKRAVAKAKPLPAQVPIPQPSTSLQTTAIPQPLITPSKREWPYEIPSFYDQLSQCTKRKRDRKQSDEESDQEQYPQSGALAKLSGFKTRTKKRKLLPRSSAVVKSSTTTKANAPSTVNEQSTAATPTQEEIDPAVRSSDVPSTQPQEENDPAEQEEGDAAPQESDREEEDHPADTSSDLTGGEVQTEIDSAKASPSANGTKSQEELRPGATPSNTIETQPREKADVLATSSADALTQCQDVHPAGLSSDVTSTQSQEEINPSERSSDKLDVDDVIFELNTWRPSNKSAKSPRDISPRLTREQAARLIYHSVSPVSGRLARQSFISTPSITVHGPPAGATTSDDTTTISTAFLSPPQIKGRRVVTPKPSIRNIQPDSGNLRTPESDNSSTCNPSSGNLHIKDMTRSLDETELSSTCNLTPPDPREDARLLRMIITGGGSITPDNRIVNVSKVNSSLQPTADDAMSPSTPSHSSTNIDTISHGTPQATFNMTTSANQPVALNQSAEINSELNRHDIQPDNEESAQAIDMTTLSNQPTALDESNEVDLESNQHDIKPKDEDLQSADPDRPDMRSDSPIEISTFSPGACRGNTGGKQAAAAHEAIEEQQSPDAPIKKFAELTLNEDFSPNTPTPKAGDHSGKKEHRVTRAEAKRQQVLKESQQYGIGPLSDEWEKKIQSALRSGSGSLSDTDLTRVVPLGTSEGTDNWLNDEVINAYLKIICAHGRKNDRPTQVPTHYSFVSFFFNNLAEKGFEAVKRWATRGKIGGKNLLDTKYVFIPINSGMHWTLCVVSGKDKTITHYNSLGGNGQRYVDTVKIWVKAELGSMFVEEDWKLVPNGKSPQQANMDDCGVFTITSARQIMLGKEPMSYNAGQIPLQRKRIVAELINEGLIKSNE